MPRGPRIAFPGAVFHVINRFVSRHPYFKNAEDRAAFLDAFFEAAATFDIRVFAYHLMPNHFHFLIMTASGEISKFLQRFLTRAVQRLNKDHRRIGHLLQGRTKTLLVDETAYFDTVMAYVLTNGSRAGLAGSAIEDRSGSAAEMLSPGAGRIDRSTLWPILFGAEFTDETKSRELNRCRKWLQQIDPRSIRTEFEENHRGSFLGSQDFRKRILDRTERRKLAAERRKGRKSDRDKSRNSLRSDWPAILKSAEKFIDRADWQKCWRSRPVASRHLGWYLAVQGIGWSYAELRERAAEPGAPHSRYTMAITEIRRDPSKRGLADDLIRATLGPETVKLSE